MIFDDDDGSIDEFDTIKDDEALFAEAEDEGENDNEARLNAFLASRLLPVVDGNVQDETGPPLSCLEASMKRFLRTRSPEPIAVGRALGTELWLGFDGEWVFDPETLTNRILSIQIYVPPQPGLSSDPAKAKQVQALSRVIFATGPTREGRPSLKKALHRLIRDMLKDRLIRQAPSCIYIVGFALRFDLAACGDFSELKMEVDTVSGKVATVNRDAPLLFSKGMKTERIDLHFIDVAAHVPVGTSLRQLGQLLNLPKLTIPAPFSIERMDEYLREDPQGYRAYALRDAEIAVCYARRLSAFAANKLGIKSLPATASGLALKWLLNTLKAEGIDKFDAFAWFRVKQESYHPVTKQRRTKSDYEPTPMRRIHEAFLTDCYAGGRNESFYFGPSPGDHWFDYDLAGAYSTGLVDIPLIDFDHPRATLEVDEYLGHVAGYALIEFEHPPETRFPVFAVSCEEYGLIFPLNGQAYATAPEIRAAHDLGCRIKIHWGVIFPWRYLPGDPGCDGVPERRLFGSFVKQARQLRTQLKQEAGGGDSIEEQAAKLYANSVYGKIAQSLRPKNVFDTREVHSVRLPPSPITNPAIAALVTGLIRAILAEILNRIPVSRMVLSVTTDGFLTNATEAEIDLSGPLCQRFQRLCEEVVPGSKMLEVKHEVAQVVCMKTRGQLTGSPWPGKRLVLAKAGVQTVIEAPPTLEADTYRSLQNAAMLALYLDRTPGQKVVRSQFPSVRDQWEKGIDLYKIFHEVALNLEPDLKRQPFAPTLVMVEACQREHVALQTRPWSRVEDFLLVRRAFDVWRRSNCLKRLEDWEALVGMMGFHRARVRRRSGGGATLNWRTGQSETDLLRRAFLRAYANRALGLHREMTYDQLAEWLTGLGLATRSSEARSAKSKPLVTHLVPRTAAVMAVWQRLQERFPQADLAELLVPPDSGLF